MYTLNKHIQYKWINAKTYRRKDTYVIDRIGDIITYGKAIDVARARFEKKTICQTMIQFFFSISALNKNERQPNQDKKPMSHVFT